MDLDLWTPGSWPLRGLGPREGLRSGVTWPSRRDQSGADGPTSQRIRSGSWRRVGHNLWLPADIDATDPGQRVVEAGALLAPYGGVTGWASLSWLGGVWFTGEGPGGELSPVPIAVSSGNRRRRCAALIVSQEVVAPSDLMRWLGVRVTTPLRSVAYEMRKATTDERAVVAFDMAAFNDLVSIAELTAYVDSDLVARQGVGRVRRVLSLLDENVWSPMEPILQLTWQRVVSCAGLLMNRPVFDLHGRFVGTPDAIDPHAGVYGMYDGALHLAGEVRQVDVVKEAAYRALGLEGVTMMAGDLADRAPFEHRLVEAYARATRRSTDRAWTLETPPWWLDTTTVAARRTLSSYDRQRLLAHRQRAA